MASESTTFQEKRFLDRLGFWARHIQNPMGTGIPRRILLRTYLDTMDKRADWGDIDSEEIRRYLLSLLK